MFDQEPKPQQIITVTTSHLTKSFPVRNYESYIMLLLTIFVTIIFVSSTCQLYLLPSLTINSQHGGWFLMVLGCSSAISFSVRWKPCGWKYMVPPLRGALWRYRFPWKLVALRMSGPRGVSLTTRGSPVMDPSTSTIQHHLQGNHQFLGYSIFGQIHN